MNIPSGGVQFHPKDSHKHGKTILKKFPRLGKKTKQKHKELEFNIKRIPNSFDMLEILIIFSRSSSCILNIT
jgi:hypothetical protein